MNSTAKITLTRRDLLGVLLIYALLSAIYIIPALKGVPGGDGCGNYHGFWWFKKALLSFRHPFYSDYFYFPQGANLAFYGGASYASFLLTLPVSLVAGIHPAVISGHYLGYLLSGFFTFLLAFELTGSKWGAFVSGLVFAFAPYHFSNVPIAMILSSLQWLPLFFWTLARALDRLTLRWAVASGGALALVILADQMQAIMTAMILACLVPALLVHSVRASAEIGPGTVRRALFVVAAIGLVSLLLASPYLYAFFDFMSTSSSNLVVEHFDRRGANRFSADLLSFFLPPGYNPLFGRLVTGIAAVSGNEHYLGLVAMALAGIGFLAHRRDWKVLFILLMTLLAFLLSMGPTLHLNGAWEWNGKIVKLPFYFTADWPVLGKIRTPYRFHPITLLGVSLLAAYGIARIERHRGAASWRCRVCAGLACCILIEFLPGKNEFPIVDKAPSIYYAMAQDREDYTVLQLPLSRWDALRRNGAGSPAKNIYYQSIHGKRIFSGHMSRAQDVSLDFADPVLEMFKDVTQYENYDVVGTEKREATAQEVETARVNARQLAGLKDVFVRKYRVRYIIIQSPLTYRGSMTRAFVEEFTGLKLIDDPKDGTTYVKLQ